MGFAQSTVNGRASRFHEKFTHGKGCLACESFSRRDHGRRSRRMRRGHHPDRQFFCDLPSRLRHPRFCDCRTSLHRIRYVLRRRCNSPARVYVLGNDLRHRVRDTSGVRGADPDAGKASSMEIAPVLIIGTEFGFAIWLATHGPTDIVGMGLLFILPSVTGILVAVNIDRIRARFASGPASR